ncbi:YihY/virulence factor BrkB family protein [Pseudoflavonifractor sp. An85]|uniref:YihY/virulence factor BrkB family protein n=1 Tax=Pseudoflavonifractor sp. An85 TaxID=1965661 RepID=UPI000B39C51F|nr:YihY/virulence factor BrkB family protein [Pseudoflavonifractor sp. An85]OUN21059.1 hypothetical protein B5G37_11585 [Pseudoflavonifractor sp. An85]
MKRLLERFLRLPPVAFVSDVVGLYFSCRVSRAAAELAYFLVLTFFPILICISAFVSKLNLEMSALLEEASYVLPQEVLVIFRDYLGYIDTHQSDAMLVAGLVMSALFASAAVRGLMNIMHEIYGRATFLGVRQLVASFVFSILLLVTIYLSITVVVTGNWFFRMVGQLLRLEDLVAQVDTWQWSKYLLLIALVFLFILLLYRFAAPLSHPRPPVIPGALLAAVALTIASMIFSTFMEHSTRYSLVYGSLTSVIILLVWLYLCGNILIVGGLVNYAIYQRIHE